MKRSRMKITATFSALAIVSLACDDKVDEVQVNSVDAEYSPDCADPADKAPAPGDVLELEIVNHDKDGHAIAVDRDVTCSVDVPVNLQK